MAETYIERLKASRQSSAQSTKEQREQAAMFAELKKMQMASLMGSQGKSTVILTDQTDLGDKVKELTAKTVAAIQGLDLTVASNKQLQAIKELRGDIVSVEQAVRRYETAIERQTVQLVAAINKLELSPHITVPTPQVTVKESAINLKPLETAINSLKVTKTINLSDYRAHDIADTADGKQHVGFMALDGTWYIMESDDASNTLRYYFGAGGYAEAWNYRSGHTYTTLSEAARGLSA